MIINGSVSQNTRGFGFSLDATEISTDIAANTSKVKVEVKLEYKNFGWDSDNTYYGAININGVNTAFSYVSHKPYGYSGTVTIGTAEVIVPHNNDGTKTASISATFSSSGTYAPGYCSASGTMQLTQLARFAEITADQDSIDIGQVAGFTIVPNQPYQAVARIGNEVIISSAITSSTKFYVNTNTLGQDIAQAIAAQGTKALTVTTVTEAGERSASVNVVYEVPQLRIQVYRVASIGSTTPAAKGQYGYIRFYMSGDITSASYTVSGQTKTVTTDQDWFTAPLSQRMVVTAQIADAFGITVSAQFTLASSEVPVSYYDNTDGVGISFGEMATEPGINADPDIGFTDRGALAWINLIYPVGAYYWSNVTGSGSDGCPITAGTWERIENRFLYAASSSHPAGETGGAEHIGIYGNAQESSAGNWGAQSGGGFTNRLVVHDDSYVSSMSTGTNIMPPYVAAYCWVRTA